MDSNFDFFPKNKPHFNFKKSTQENIKVALSPSFLFQVSWLLFIFGAVSYYIQKDDDSSRAMVEVLASEVAKAPSRIPHETRDAVMNDAEVKKAMAAAFLKQAKNPNKPILLETEQTP